LADRAYNQSLDGKLKISLLWVEDDPNDVLLIKRAFKKIGVEPVHICSNGEEAVRYLQGEPPFDNRVQYPTPTLIVSDLKMPRMGGLELLEWFRDHPTCYVLPIVIFSASGEEQDIEKAYRLGASGFFQKPLGMDNIINVIGRIVAYWSEAYTPRPPAKC
jgi:CheY-like chemotaxis protein